MSFFSNASAPVKFVRSFFFLCALSGGISLFFPMINYAANAENITSDTSQENVLSMDIIHVHKGNESVNDGCFQKQTTKTVECNGTTYDIEYEHIEAPDGYGLNYTNYGVKCHVCGHEKWFGNLAERWHYNNGYRPDCTGSVTTTVYAPVCGMENQQKVGVFTLTSSSQNWVSEVTLTAEYTAEEALKVKETPYIWNGGEPSNHSSYKVTENGTYTLSLALSDESNTDVGTLTMEIRNVDNSVPVIEDVSYDRSENAASVTLKVTASDLQPDGSVGSGLHNEAFSYDGGKTWTSSDTFTVNQNKEVVIAVRDLVGNITYRTENITNIDTTGPDIFYRLEHHSWTKEDVTLYLWAEDKNPKGNAGIGLPMEWYSLDGGSTWQNAGSVIYKENQSVRIIARDRHGNVTQKVVTINQIDKEPPQAALTQETVTEGNEKKVVLIASGEDSVSGLPKEAFSWDGGRSYGKEHMKEITENGLYRVTIRDNAGNWNYAQIEVNCFGKEKKSTVSQNKIGVKESNAKKTTGRKYTGISKVVPEKQKYEKKTVDVTMEETIEKPSEKVVHQVEKDHWDYKDTIAVVSLLLPVLGLLIFVVLRCLRTIKVYSEDADGNMEYMGRPWIYGKEEGYEVSIPESTFEKCVTTHFLLCPGFLFVAFHKGENISCLFPEDICIMKPIESNIEISLL